MNVFEFMRGQGDCKKGIPHTDQGEDYNRGYQTQYELEQVLNNQTKRRDNGH